MEAQWQDQILVVKEGIQSFFEFEAKDDQARCIAHLLFKQRDLILTAKTSFGKSLIHQALPCLSRGSVVIVIVPLDALGKEQEKKISSIPRTRPIFLNASNMNDGAIQEVQKGAYTHIITSPEQLIGKRFRILIQDRLFRSHLLSICIDELHLVFDWGDKFRHSYTELRIVRRELEDIPWFGTTATLDRLTLSYVRGLLELSDHVQVIQTDTNQEDLTYIVKQIPIHTQKSFLGLNFLLE
ncbi:P-loop containing nucleoside triphosphate hydrolase protein, partial [Eremomyces bilateralis CBS 781.70]